MKRKRKRLWAKLLIFGVLLLTPLSDITTVGEAEAPLTVYALRIICTAADGSHYKDSATVFCIGIGAAILAVIIIITAIIIMMRRKQKKRAAINNADNIESNIEVLPIPPTEPVKRLELKLTAIGHKDITHKITLYEGTEVLIGRSSKANIILDPGDRQISGLHCAMKWKNNKIYISDMGSMNDTYVNGIPIKKMGRVVINKGDTVRIGSYEYRIGG